MNVSEVDFRKLFVWSGERNFYDRCQIFWTFASGADALDFEEWKTFWGSNGDVGASNEKLTWLSDRSDMAATSLESLTLDRKATAPNPGLNAATDGNNAGADIAKLPRPIEVEPRSE